MFIETFIFECNLEEVISTFSNRQIDIKIIFLRI